METYGTAKHDIEAEVTRYCAKNNLPRSLTYTLLRTKHQIATVDWKLKYLTVKM